MKRILILNGPNLNMLGIRETNIYGNKSFNEIMSDLEKIASNNNIELISKQSNHEGVLVDELHLANKVFDCIILNAGALTHYSYAIRDAISLIETPVIEVHMSNIYAREKFRHKSVIAPVCCGQISGFQANSYVLALQAGIGIIT